VNVRQESLASALATLRSAAAGAPRRLELSLGPVATFLPDNPVLYLAVAGDIEPLLALRDRALRGPLDRPLTWPFVPHVTLADDAAPDRIAAATFALARYQALTTIDTVHLLREQGRGGDRRWAPIADVALGPPAVVGRGGLALELVRSQMLDPEAAALVSAELGDEPAGLPAFAGRPVVLTGRREGAVVGLAAAWLADDGGHVAVLVASGSRAQGVGGHLLAATEAAVAGEGWACPRLEAHGPAGFYAARSRWSSPGYSKAMDE
jgi:2'-5' RNA ligase